MKSTSSDITVTDLFCGAGGSTTGSVQAGASVRLAVNHWARAIETHHTNYPHVDHVLTDISQADPRRYPSTTILIASPECVNHSLAKGRSRKLTQGQQATLWEPAQPPKPEDERSRCTMWDPLRFAEYHEYQAVILENVVDARSWRMWDAWLHAWQTLDYEWGTVYFNSQFAHPTPQSRDRMYFVAWKRGNRRPDLAITPLAYCPRCEQDVASVQSWKDPGKRYGKYRQQYVYCCPHCARQIAPYYYAAANAIDWSLPTPRIGNRERPLQPKTMQRIAYGLQQFARQPFLVQVNKSSDRLRSLHHAVFPTQTGNNGLAMVFPFLLTLNHSTPRTTAAMTHPLPTQTAYDDTGMVVPPALLLHTSHGECEHASYVASVHDTPCPTQTCRQDLTLVLPFIAELHGTSQARCVTEALATVCAGGEHHGLVMPPPFLLDHLGEYRPRDLTGPFSTICAAGNHHSLITPPAWNWLMTYYHNGRMVPIQEPAPTVTTLERHALVTAEAGAEIKVEDCGFRMLSPKEIQAAMAFPPEYVVTGTRREQVKQLGNAVTPPVMKVLMERVLASLS